MSARLPDSGPKSGPADGPFVIPGRWLFLSPDTLQIAAMDGSGEFHLFTIVSCDSNRLVVTS